MDSRRLSFGQFQFDPRTLELRKGGHPVPLAPKPSRALGRLLEKPGEIVLRDDLIETLWTESPIEVDRSLNFAIRQIRTALGDDANRPIFLETLPRRGYRFIAPVAHAQSEPGGTNGVEKTSTARAAEPPRATNRSVWFAGATAAVAMLTVSLFLIDSDETPRVAVLPIEQLGNTSHDYFVTGLRHELVAELARFPTDQLTLIARYSTAQMADATLEEIVQQIDATYVLRGSLTEKGNGVRLVFELISAPQGQVVWAERFEETLPTSAELEHIIAARVSEALALEILNEETTLPEHTPSPLARELYLQGTHLLRAGSRDKIPEAVEFLRNALAETPNYPEAHVALGRALLQNGDRLGREHIERAVALDPLVAGAYEALGDDDLYHNWDTLNAARYFDLAITSRPGAAEPYHRRAYFLSLQGKHELAIASITRALQLDPVSPIVTGDVGRLYYRAGQFEKAEEFCQRSLDLLGNEYTARSCLLNLRLLAGDAAGGVNHAIALLGMYGANDGFLDYLRGAPAEEAIDAYWRWIIRAWTYRVDQDPDALLPIAQAHVWLGDHESALSTLEQALLRGSTGLPLVAGDPCFAPLFSNPRYQKLFEQAGLPLAPPPNLS